jgi:hypothetical protein
MLIELLSFDGCPSHEALLSRLAVLLGEAGVDAPVRQRRVASDADVRRERFLGSPTPRIDGVDVDVDQTADERRDFGVKCRLRDRGAAGDAAGCVGPGCDAARASCAASGS